MMSESDTMDFAAARRAMIDSQLRTSGVNDPFVIKAMGRVPREEYVPANARGGAYIDRSVRLGDGAYLAPPVFYGMMLTHAAPTVQDRVLVVDAGSGYLPALVEQTVAQVEAVSPDEAIKPSRKKGDFTLLLIDGAIEEFPASLTKRLAPDARIVTGKVERGVTRLAAGRIVDGMASFANKSEMGIPVLPAFAAKKEWSF